MSAEHEDHPRNDDGAEMAESKGGSRASARAGGKSLQRLRDLLPVEDVSQADLHGKGVQGSDLL